MDARSGTGGYVDVEIGWSDNGGVTATPPEVHVGDPAKGKKPDVRFVVSADWPPEATRVVVDFEKDKDKDKDKGKGAASAKCPFDGFGVERSAAGELVFVSSANKKLNGSYKYAVRYLRADGSTVAEVDPKVINDDWP